MKTIYTAVFFRPEDIREKCLVTLEKPVNDPHVTIRFRPAPGTDHRELIGAPADVEFCAYGCDGRNEGYLVRVHAGNEALQALLETVPLPHVTTSVSLAGKPADTAELAFSPVEPFTITGWYGIYTDNGRALYANDAFPGGRA